MLARLITVIAIVVVMVAGCEQTSPKRDQIPILKSQLLNLQNAVSDRNRAAIDSLLSVKIVSREQGSDSLLSFVYGPDSSYAFERFGNYNIVYTSDKARIECYIMDSTSQTDRPVVFYLAHEHEMWLITSFEEGQAEPADSTE